MRDRKLPRLGLGALCILWGSLLVSCVTPGEILPTELTPLKPAGIPVASAYPASCENVLITNPATSYCSLLGYQTGIQDTAQGQVGICTLPDGEVCGEWDFFRGKCGQDFTWCAVNGLQVRAVSESDGSSIQEYAVCIDESGNVVGKVLELSGLQALMDACRR